MKAFEMWQFWSKKAWHDSTKTSFFKNIPTDSTFDRICLIDVWTIRYYKFDVAGLTRLEASIGEKWERAYSAPTPEGRGVKFLAIKFGYASKVSVCEIYWLITIREMLLEVPRNYDDKNFILSNDPQLIFGQ